MEPLIYSSLKSSTYWECVSQARIVNMLLELAVNDSGQLVADKPREKERERER